MAIVNLGNHPLGGGATVVGLVFDVTTSQSAPRLEEDRIVVGKPLAGSGQIGITAVARFSVQGTTPGHLFGIKQVALHRGVTVEYSGLKNIDGSITEGTSTLNFTTMLDVAVLLDAATSALIAPHAPFYAESPALIRPGAQVELTAKDAPGGAFPREKRNHITDRPNLLDSAEQSTDFATFLVVQLPNRSHLAIAGFRWTYASSAEVRWSKGQPTVSGTVRHDFQTSATRRDLTAAEIGIMENPGLRFADSIVARVNRAKSAANTQHVASPIGSGAPAKIDGGGYSIEQFDRYNNVIKHSAKTVL